MTIIRSPRVQRDFTIISNSVCMDTRLSMRALGLLVRLLCRPDDWRTNSQTLAREFNVGREQMQGVLRELSACGYMRLIKVRNEDGTFRSYWAVYDEPQAEEPAPEKPYSGASGSLPRTDLPRTDTNTPIAPKGAAPVKGEAKEKKARAKKAECSLPDWLETIKARGEDAIPADDPVYAYIDKIGLTDSMLLLAWGAFKARYSQPGAKTYIDWRQVFRNAIEGNWLGLWWRDEQAGEWVLTTKGVQARLAQEAA